MPKPTRALKTTDSKAGKPWLKKRGKSKYEIESRDVKPYILIVCEGQTEKHYFDSFPIVNLKTRIFDTKGQSKIKLVKKALDLREEEKYDSIWCVFDMDINRAEKEFRDYDNAIKKAFASGFQVAYSNDAFELWFYLHYQYCDQEHRRTFYYSALSDFLGVKYEEIGKSEYFSKSIYRLLAADEKASMENAIAFAKKLHEQCKDQTYHRQNPVTTVYMLVEFLVKHCKQL